MSKLYTSGTLSKKWIWIRNFNLCISTAILPSCLPVPLSRSSSTILFRILYSWDLKIVSPLYQPNIVSNFGFCNFFKIQKYPPCDALLGSSTSSLGPCTPKGDQKRFQKVSSSWSCCIDIVENVLFQSPLRVQGLRELVNDLSNKPLPFITSVSILLWSPLSTASWVEMEGKCCASVTT